MMTSLRNKKNGHNFMRYFHVLQDNIDASARNNVWDLSFEEGKKLQQKQ